MSPHPSSRCPRSSSRSAPSACWYDATPSWRSCAWSMLNATNLALVTFSRVNGNLDGQIAAFFVMVAAAAEVVVGLAIIMTIFRTRRSASSTTPACSSTRGICDHTCPRAGRDGRAGHVPVVDPTSAARWPGRSRSWSRCPRSARPRCCSGGRTNRWGTGSGSPWWRARRVWWVLSSLILGLEPSTGRSRWDLWTWFTARTWQVELEAFLRPALRAVPAADHRSRWADPRVLGGLHGAR